MGWQDEQAYKGDIHMAHSHMRKYSLSLRNREKQKWMRYNLMSVRMVHKQKMYINKKCKNSFGGDVMRKEHLSSVCKDFVWFGHYGKQYRHLPFKILMEQLKDPWIPLLAMCL